MNTELISIMKQVKFRKKTKNDLRLKIVGDKGEQECLGYCNLPFKSSGYTNFMKKNFFIYLQLRDWFNKYCDNKQFEFNCIQLSKNVCVKKHKDVNNVGDSYFLYTFDGEAEGGELIVYDKDEENKIEQVIKPNQLVMFDGKKQFHEGKPHKGADRYSIVFFKNCHFETSKAIEDSYVICIPSHNRPEILNNKTLRTLDRFGIDPKKIFIYVAKGEVKEYRKILDKKLYNAIKISKLGVVENRNYISKDYPTEIKIVYLDDDVDDFDLSIMKQFFLYK